MSVSVTHHIGIPLLNGENVYKLKVLKERKSAYDV